ncbi:MAG TPA: adenylate/guanylate cyclase domain-containing protein [Natronosporangium sp.]|nr:adenylate/guanylate cyclase domain-containing protein [Natronosporangium sp.]
MSCPRCGRTAREGDRFCGGCGAELTAVCRGCGRTLAADVAYCTGCGTAREAPQLTPTLPTEERRRVSVLFVDLVDSTLYAERSDPELVRRLQTAFYATARRVVRQYGGVVEKYIGDAVMALFGAPVATETDPLRCVRAGLELQRALPASVASIDPQLRFRIGIATGEALVDLAAARDGGQGIVVGDVVNTAARLQAVAPSGGVLVCGHTQALTRDTVHYRAQPPVVLRGRSTPTEVWLALEAVQRSETEPDALPLVEREHELSLLVNALNRTVYEGVPQLVTIFGQAGIGKSRLVRELHRHARRLEPPPAWRVGHCPPFGEDVTYAGLAEIVKAEVGIRDTDPAESVRARLFEATRRVCPPGEAERVARALGALVGLPDAADLPLQEVQPAWRRFLVASAARRPTVLVFEDLHWADEPMLRFVELLAAAAKEVPLLVLTTARPELVDRDASWAGTITGSLTITLPPLRRSGIATLFGQLLGQASHAADLLQPLLELADGNPLYAQEYVRMLIERNALTRSGPPEPWDVSGLPTPDSVYTVIAHRLDLLEPADRAVLQAAAVVGVQFWRGAVAAALGWRPERVEHALRRLEQREFVSEQPDSSVLGDSEFRFRHVLVRDVCYQRLPRAERVARHERTAEWLEELAGAPDGELAEVLAHHWWTAYEIARTLGEPPPRTATAARRALYHAARRAYALHALDTAARHTGRALALGDPPDDSPAGPVARVDRLRLELLDHEIAFYRDQAGFLTGDGPRQLATLAERLAAAGCGAEAARAWTLLGQAAWVRADRNTALANLERAVALFAHLPDTPEKVDAYAELGRLHMLDYERDPAVAAAETAAAIAQRLGLPEAQANARITVATARYDAGDPDALAELEQVRRWCLEARLLALPRATQNLANAVLEEGDWRRCVALMEERLPEVPGAHRLAAGYSAAALRAYATGDLDAVIAAVEASADLPGGRWDVRARGLRGLIRVLRAQPDDGEVESALAMARDGAFHRPLWTALGMASLCRALQGRADEAVKLVGELVASWGPMAVIPSGAWVCAAGHAVAVAAADPGADMAAAGAQAEALRAVLADAVRLTRWGRAALHTAEAAVRRTGGDPAGAGRAHLAAAQVYDDLASVTDRMFSLALAVEALEHAGLAEAAGPARTELDGFVTRNRSPRLLSLATRTAQSR